MDENTPHTGTPAAEALTDDERSTVRDAALGAIALVSKADSGFFAMFKESMAGSRALQDAPPGVKDLLNAGGFPTPPTGSSKEEVNSKILAELTSAMGIVRAKAPAEADGYKQVILSACDAVANADDGVAPEEQAAIDQVRAALGA